MPRLGSDLQSDFPLLDIIEQIGTSCGVPDILHAALYPNIRYLETELLLTRACVGVRYQGAVGSRGAANACPLTRYLATYATIA